MTALFSPVIGVILKAVRKSSKGLMRDFNEVRYLRSSYATASEFTRAAYARSSRIISEELSYYKQGLEMFFEGTRSAENPEGTFWFVSPIDSRTNFMSGIPYFATAVALVKNGEVIAAVVDAPALNETYYAEKGFGAFVESSQGRYTRLRITNKSSIHAAVLDFTAGCANVRDVVCKLASNHIVLRSMGSVVLGISYLCSACYDIVIYSGVQEYKAGMATLFVEESKGHVSLDGNLLYASNSELLTFLGKEGLLHDSEENN